MVTLDIAAIRARTERLMSGAPAAPKAPQEPERDWLKPLMFGQPRVLDILHEVSRDLCIPFNQLISHRRRADLVRARQIAMYLARELTSKSFPEIGNVIGGRDHTTILHGCKVIEARMGGDLVLVADVLRIRAAIEARMPKMEGDT